MRKRRAFIEFFGFGRVRRSIAVALASAAALLSPLGAFALDPPSKEPEPERKFGQPVVSRSDEKRRLEKEFDEAFERSDWPAAEAALRQLTDVDKKNFVPPYNLACVLAMEGKTKEATDALQLA